MRYIVLFLALIVAPFVGSVHADGDVLFLNANGSANVTQLTLRVIPGTTNVTSFRVVAQNDNISSLAFFAFSPDLNVTVSPSNRTLLVDGDYQLVTVSVGVANNTQAGFKAASIMILTTKPQQLLMPLLVEIPSTTKWNVTPRDVIRNVTGREFGAVNVTLSNTGNILVTGHVSIVDTRDLIFFDESAFSLEPGVPLTRPLYYFIPHITPGTYPVTVTFVDMLQNARKVQINFTLPDTTPPAVNVSLDRDEIYPGQTLGVAIWATDDVNVTGVACRLDGADPLTAALNNDGTYSVRLQDLAVGNHSLLVVANDSVGNTGSATLIFQVLPFRFLNITGRIDLLKFLPGQVRTLKLMNALTSVPLNFTLAELRPSGTANQTVFISVDGVRLTEGSTVSLTVAGDVFISAEGTNYTTFSGVLLVDAGANVANPAPRVEFGGELANYSITPAFNVSLPGFSSLEVCTPRVASTYEESALVCCSEFRADTSQDQVGIVGSPSSLEAERTGWRTDRDNWKQQAQTAQFWNLIIIIIVLIVAASYVVKRKWIDETRVVR